MRGLRPLRLFRVLEIIEWSRVKTVRQLLAECLFLAFGFFAGIVSLAAILSGFQAQTFAEYLGVLLGKSSADHFLLSLVHYLVNTLFLAKLILKVFTIIEAVETPICTLVWAAKLTDKELCG
jgi:hypothetical protein